MPFANAGSAAAKADSVECSARKSNTSAPARLFRAPLADDLPLNYSKACSDLMAERARATWGVFRALFDALDRHLGARTLGEPDSVRARRSPALDASLDPMAAWYEELFDERYLIFYEEAFEAGASAEEIDFIDRALGLPAGSHILDLGCGFGRHAIPLAHRGYRVTGIDLSQTLLDAAQKIARQLGTEVAWLHRDMRQLGDAGPFDACVCLYTAFGYFGDDDNARVLAEVRERLRPGGALLLHVDNPLAIVPRVPDERWSEGSRGVRRESHEYDALTGRLVSKRAILLGEGRRLDLPTSSVRLYAPHETAALLRGVELEIEQLHGGLRGEAFQWKRSPMQAWVARRP
jgi:SAM-dependent methyltransferase